MTKWGGRERGGGKQSEVTKGLWRQRKRRGEPSKNSNYRILVWLWEGKGLLEMVFLFGFPNPRLGPDDFSWHSGHNICLFVTCRYIISHHFSSWLWYPCRVLIWPSFVWCTSALIQPECYCGAIPVQFIFTPSFILVHIVTPQCLSHVGICPLIAINPCALRSFNIFALDCLLYL